jgi:translation initiation factor 3 subunit M
MKSSLNFRPVILNLQNYLEFYGSNGDFVSSLGLSHEANIHKMRILTFMSMSAGDSKVIPFSEIQANLQLGAEDVESKKWS